MSALLNRIKKRRKGDNSLPIFSELVMQSNKIENFKAERQRVKREARKGARYTRQKNERREGPNVRIRVCVQPSNPSAGYSYTRLRDGKTV